MVVDELNDSLLVHELQLGEQLNECVHTKRRSDFSLMLAMLTDDVRAHSQFLVPQAQIEDKQPTDSALRKHFSLPEPAALAIKNIDELEQFNQAQLVHQQRIAELKLTDALAPKALAFRDDAKHIPHDVLSNTSLYCQQNHKNNAANNSNNKASRLNFDAINWLKSVQTTIVKSALITA